MKSKHTPGPWNMNRYRGFVVDESTEVICQFFSKHEDELYEKATANAQLIAAAPDMLEALEEVIKSLETGKWNKSTYPMAKEAIKKAIGE